MCACIALDNPILLLESPQNPHIKNLRRPTSKVSASSPRCRGRSHKRKRSSGVSPSS